MDSQTVVKTFILNRSHQNNLSTQQNVINFSDDDAEISIFDAHKYFNDIQPDQALSSVHGRSRNPSSENSQTGLLPNPPNNVSANYSSKWISSAMKWLFRTKCCCNAEKSVQVKQVNSDSKHNESVGMIETKNTAENIVEIHHIKAMAVSAMDGRMSAPARSFIDGAVGFTFPILNSNSSSDGFRANYKVESMDNRSGDDDDDVGSEASSDLFEIESFSTQTASYRDSSDDQDQTCKIDDIQWGRRSVEAERECFLSRLTPPAKARPLGSSHSGAIEASTTYHAVFSTTVI